MDSDANVTRIAVIGAGPAGFYATEALLKGLGDAVSVDLIERLPTPYGLVRFGVAPITRRSSPSRASTTAPSPIRASGTSATSSSAST